MSPALERVLCGVADVLCPCGYEGEPFTPEHDARHERWLEGDGDDVCQTPGCDGDPSDGEGWDGYCGNCADAREGVETV